MEANAVRLAAALITIVRAISDIYRKFKRPREAEALEKAVKKIESSGNIPQQRAKEILAQTLTQELGEKDAQPLIAYVNALDTFFPLRPSAAPLQYGLAIAQLVRQIYDVLIRFQAFKLYGEKLAFYHSGMAFYGIGAHSELLPSGVGSYALGAHMCETISGMEGKGVVVPVWIMKDHFVLHAESSGTVFPVFVEADEQFPFSLAFSNPEGKAVVKRLTPFNFEMCTEALMRDAKDYIEKVAREVEESKEQASNFSLAIEALRKLTTT